MGERLRNNRPYDDPESMHGTTILRIPQLAEVETEDGETKTEPSFSQRIISSPPGKLLQDIEPAQDETFEDFDAILNDTPHVTRGEE